MQESHDWSKKQYGRALAIVFFVLTSSNSIAQEKQILRDYSPVYKKGEYFISTQFNICNISLKLSEGNRLWFNGGWAAFIDQNASKEIERTDAQILQSNVSWSVIAPANYKNYWVWIACDPPPDPFSERQSDSENFCKSAANDFLKNGKKNKILLVQRGQNRDAKLLILNKKKGAEISFQFCWSQNKHIIFGGGKLLNKNNNFENLSQIIDSIEFRK